jgi:hypothetical protein
MRIYGRNGHSGQYVRGATNMSRASVDYSKNIVRANKPRAIR